MPHVDASLADFADAAVVSRLSTGLPQTLALEIEAVPHGGGARIALVRRTCAVVYDLWEEVFRVEIVGRESRGTTLATVDAVVDACLRAHDLAIGVPAQFEHLHGQAIELILRAQLNPLTPDTVHRIRRWLARPGGAREPADTFFGSFVGLFVNRSVAGAEATLEGTSASIEVP